MPHLSGKRAYFPALILALFLVVVLQFYPSGNATPILPSQQIEDLRESILLLAQARDHALDTYNDMEKEGFSSETTRLDHQLFIDYLDSRIAVYCKELHDLSGSLAIADLPCSFPTGVGRSGGDLVMLPSETSSTTDEQIAALDESLNAALGEFDDMLLQEQKTVAMHVPSQTEGGKNTSHSDSQAGDEEGRRDQGDESGRQETESGESEKEPAAPNGEGTDSSDKSRKGAGAGDGTEGADRDSSSQSDRLDASDDDVVARQLREAAEKETDPEVKKKLWEEYRKYKESTR